jgi:hypothetical protein
VPESDPCEELYDEMEQALEDAQGALDEYHSALEDMESTFGDVLSGLASASAHLLNGEYGDAFDGALDAYTGDHDFDNAESQVGRAEAKWREEDRDYDKAIGSWCEKCDTEELDEYEYSIDELEELLGEHEDTSIPGFVEFEEDDAEVIVGYP